MSYGKIPFEEKVPAGRRWGVDIGDWHIHCSKIKKEDNEYVLLLDNRDNTIARVRENDIKQITICGADYWTVFSTVYVRDW